MNTQGTRSSRTPLPRAHSLVALLATAGLVGYAHGRLPQNVDDEPRVNPVEEPDLPGEVSGWLSPGTDICLGLSWEPTVAVDPNNQLIVAAAQGTTMRISFDGGVTFPQTVTATVPPGNVAQGDPSVGFDSQGRLFITYLCAPASGRDVCITGYELNLISGMFQPIAGISWPRNVTALANHAAPNNADKEWLAVDAWPGSPYTDRLHVVWTDLDQSPWEVWTTFSTDQGQTWSNALRVSVDDEGPVPWPAHNAVAPNGDVYVAWHSQLGFLDAGTRVPDGVSGQIVLRRSTNGGASFGARSFPYTAGQADMTWNVQHLANGVVPGARYWLQGSSQPWILPDPQQAGRVYVVANDDPDNDVDVGDPADVFIVASDDNGATWGAPIRVDSGPAGTFAVMPTAAIDPITGAIAVCYYDNRGGFTNTAGNFLLDLLVTYSWDGGLTWGVEFDVNDGFFDPDGTTSCRFCCNNMSGCFGQPITTRIGEYNGIAYGECGAKIVWADNQQCGSGGSQLDILFDADPEAGGDFDPPTIFCPPNVSLGCNDSMDPSETGFATATDDCTIDPAIGYVDLPLGGNCPPSTVIQSTRRIWNAVDEAGNINTCDQIISVVDFDAPELSGPPDLFLECNGDGGVLATDPVVQAWAAQFSAVDECSDVTKSLNLPKLFPSGCKPGQETLVIYSAADECNNGDFLVRTVTVVDTTPPELSCDAQHLVLWPPNHDFADIGLTVDTEDLCDGTDPTIDITVTSDEHPAFAPGAGGPQKCPDAIVMQDGSVWLRKQRSGVGDGRVYVVHVTATDGCGNEASCDVVVEVPPSRHGVANDSGQLYDATDCN